MNFIIKNITQLDELAKKVSCALKIHDVILLDGELGSGKTEFVRHVAKHVGVNQEITSPTFCFLNTYDTQRGFKLYHFDVYRLKHADELESVGFDECGYAPADGVAFIEWASKFESCMPEDALKLRFFGQGDEPRRIEVEAEDMRSSELLKAMKNE